MKLNGRASKMGEKRKKVQLHGDTKEAKRLKEELWTVGERMQEPMQ